MVCYKTAERKSFEAWYGATYLPTPAHGRTFNTHPSGTYCLQHVQDAWQAWAAAKQDSSQAAWIKVSDRLPEDGTSVISYDGHRVIKTAFIQVGDDYCFLDVSNNCKVTHWQPFPEPPVFTANK